MTPARKPTKPTSPRAGASKRRSSGTEKGRAAASKGRSRQAKKGTKKTAAERKRTTKGAAKKVERKSTSKKATPARKVATPRARAAKTPAKRTTAAAGPTGKAGGRQVGGRRGQARGTERARVPIRPIAKKPAGRPPRPAKLDKKQLAAIRAELGQELEDLKRQQEELEQSSFTDTQSDLTGEVGLDEDFADAGTATFERERDLSIQNNIRDLIDQVTRAIGRIDEGAYGVCERCGGPIDAARLKALPHAVLCMDCKRREERAR